MLVLTRKLNEVITLGNPLSLEEAIEIEVLKLSGEQIRLGVKAPRGVAVHRKEIWLIKQEEAAQE